MTDAITGQLALADAAPDDWGHEEKPISAVTMADMEALASKGRELRAKKDELKKQESDVEQELKGVQKRIIAYLEHFGLTKYESAGGKVFVTNKRSVKVPKDEADRDSFFAWLKERGIFDQLITVNSQTLNAMYNRECDATGGDVSIPGLGPATEYKSVTFK